MSRRAILLLAAGLLGGCAGLPTPPPARDALHDFSLEGRFALRVTQPGQAPQSGGGRLTWSHQNRSDRVLLSSPLGYGLAEIEATPDGSRLRTAQGQLRESTDPDALIEEVTGHRLPVGRLPGWLLGRPGAGAKLSSDPLGRPMRLTEDGWQVDYGYDDESPDALPARLTISRNGEVELRLRIEAWKDSP